MRVAPLGGYPIAYKSQITRAKFQGVSEIFLLFRFCTCCNWFAVSYDLKSDQKVTKKVTKAARCAELGIGVFGIRIDFLAWVVIMWLWVNG